MSAYASNRGDGRQVVGPDEKIRELTAERDAWKLAALRVSLVSSLIDTSTPNKYESEMAKACCDLLSERDSARLDAAQARQELATEKAARASDFNSYMSVRDELKIARAYLEQRSDALEEARTDLHATCGSRDRWRENHRVSEMELDQRNDELRYARAEVARLQTENGQQSEQLRDIARILTGE